MTRSASGISILLLNMALKFRVASYSIQAPVSKHWITLLWQCYYQDFKVPKISYQIDRYCRN